MLVFNTEAVILRMKQILAASDDKELALKLGTSDSQVQKWEENNAIPLNDLMSVAKYADVTLDWLIFGRNASELSVDEEMILNAYRNMPKKQKIQAINYMSKLDDYGESEKQKAIAQEAVLKGDHNFINGGITINQGK